MGQEASRLTVHREWHNSECLQHSSNNKHTTTNIDGNINTNTQLLLTQKQIQQTRGLGQRVHKLDDLSIQIQILIKIRTQTQLVIQA